MKYSYFPGCSLKGLGRAYEESLLPVMKHLGVELQELEDWNCCGATAYMAVDEAKACVLAARNLALAEKQGDLPIMAPCAACYLVLNKTKHYFHDYPAMKETMDRALGAVGLQLQRRHPRAPSAGRAPQRRRPGSHQAEGAQAAEGAEGRPLLRLPACPARTRRSTTSTIPTTMDRLLEALGATVVRYPLKTKCCGGSLTGTVPEAGIRMVYILLNEAKKRGADCLATVCPLCQFNLDAYHAQVTGRVRAGAAADRLFHATDGPGLRPAGAASWA